MALLEAAHTTTGRVHSATNGLWRSALAGLQQRCSATTVAAGFASTTTTTTSSSSSSSSNTHNATAPGLLEIRE
jgi:hypothetical protein